MAAAADANVTTTQVEKKQADVALLTYRYVRMILVLPAAFLLIATVLEAISRGGFRESISDYYQGPVRDVFVGALMASGVVMVAYKGRSKLEDYALNFAGFNAFFVALVPNNFTKVLNTPTTQSLGSDEVITRAQMLTNLHLVLYALLAAAALFVFLDWRFMQWGAFKTEDAPHLAVVLIWISWVTEVAFLVVIVGGVLVGRETLFGLSIFGMLHFVAAGLLIGNLSFAVASRAFPDRLRTAVERRAATQNQRWALLSYQAIVALMWVGLLAGGLCIYLNVHYAVISVEYFEIVMFVIFWTLATRKDWTPAVTIPATDGTS
ncbi:hypothetical protein N865_19725 [Intrasporangium oryzae NRRL B-24470]|uniref:Uncharacterized protein n=1 Tax=Intrasporangium oryzae NRRL B-24470 TaxID=1386089 RepID=W9G3R4_9MICO|nr:hypothetical protein N865_19725 [Intrasporangium oryzae NRRL B-24470]